MNEHSRNVESSSGKLSQGSRVRSAADDAASLAIGLKLNSTRRSELQAIRNGNDAISQVQVAEGSMSEMSNVLGRLKELSVQAATGTLDQSQREMLNIEYMQLRNELERISDSTKYNGKHLLKAGEAQSQDFQIGINADNDSRISTDEVQFTVNEFQLGLVDSQIETQYDARLNLAQIDKAVQVLSEKRAVAGSVNSRLQTSINNLEQSNVNTASAQSRMMDADMAYEASNQILAKIKHHASSSVLAQASHMGKHALKLLE